MKQAAMLNVDLKWKFCIAPDFVYLKHVAAPLVSVAGCVPHGPID
jgi:hypothetical protein